MVKNNPMSPFEDIFKQIADMLKFIQENASKINSPEIPADITEKLVKLKQDVEKFNKMGEDFAEGWNFEKLSLKSKLPLGTLTLSKEDKQIMDRANQLKNQIETTSKAFKDIPAPTPEEGIPKPTAKPKSGKKRRSKFKRFGSNKKWKPL